MDVQIYACRRPSPDRLVRMAGTGTPETAPPRSDSRRVASSASIRRQYLASGGPTRPVRARSVATGTAAPRGRGTAERTGWAPAAPRRVAAPSPLHQVGEVIEDRQEELR